MRINLSIGLAALAALAARSSAVELEALPGHPPQALTQLRLQPLYRLPSTNWLHLAIGLPLRNTNALEHLLTDLYDLPSPRYRHYLTPEQFTQRFGPTREDYEAVSQFAVSHGFVITHRHPNRMVLEVRGSASDVERAFQVKLQVFPRPGGGTFFAPDTEPSIAAKLPALHVSGLNNFHQPRPAVHRRPWRSGGGGIGSGPGGNFLGNDFRSAYIPGVTLTGAGQTVALVEYDGFYPNDIAAYKQLAGLRDVPIRTVLVNGFSGTPGAGADTVEVATDIEMVISMAPGLSQVLVYEAPPFDDDAILNRIATDNAARQISSSWWHYPLDPTAEQIFREFAAQGQSYFGISGDWDAWPSTFLRWIEGIPTGVATPLDNPYITIVGGTTLATGPGGAWVSETVWNSGYSTGYNAPHYLGSSGGISPTYAIPTWQAGVNMAFNGGSTFRRNVPDVAMVADNIWGVVANGDSGPLVGTSEAAPLWAGFTALANELAQASGQPPVGFLNPALYRIGLGPDYHAAFHDITSGNNASSSSPTNFFAVPGYDLCTGWGTPNGSNLLYALACPQALVIWPGDDFASGGPVGGPFSPPVQTYSLTNGGATALNWQLGGLPRWLDASMTNGALAPGDAPALVIVTLNAAATVLPVGTYSQTLWFTNQNDGSTQRRLFTLEVAVVPVITRQPVSLTVLAGSSVAFPAFAEGTSPLIYQWQHGRTNISSATSNVLTLQHVLTADAGVYTLLVTNAYGSTTSTGAVLSVVPFTAPGVDMEILYSFTNGPDGANPNGLVWGPDSNLYGTANSGGLYGLGSVFRIGTDGSFSTLYSFGKNASSDGAFPTAGLVVGTNGALYGPALGRGANNAGTLFRITTNGALTTLYAFTGGSDGASPAAPLAQGTEGNFYGTAVGGGNPSLTGGTVFRLTPAGGFTLLHQFLEAEGINPVAQLLTALDGNLYGTTLAGGFTPVDGTAYRITTSGTLTPLSRFHGTNGFVESAGLAQGRDGNLYGTTALGGAFAAGTVFKLSTNGNLMTLWSFTGTGDGALPNGALLFGWDGSFYGMTSQGGDLNAQGTVFRITPDGVLTTLAWFNGVNGANPSGALVQGSDGDFYGTTLNGGAAGFGTIFRLSVPPLILSLTESSSRATLSWPAWATNFVLQQASNLAGTNWTPVVPGPVVTPTKFQVDLPLSSSGATFYRLGR